MPTTQKSQQKQTKATQKVGGSAKKPVTKAMEGGSAKKPVRKAIEGGSAKKPVRKAIEGGTGKVAMVNSKRVNKRGGGNVTVPKFVEEGFNKLKEIDEWLVSFLVKEKDTKDPTKFICFFDKNKNNGYYDDDLVYKKNGRLPGPAFNSLKLLNLVKDGNYGGYRLRDHFRFDNTKDMKEDQILENNGVDVHLYRNNDYYRKLIESGAQHYWAVQAAEEAEKTQSGELNIEDIKFDRIAPTFPSPSPPPKSNFFNSASSNSSNNSNRPSPPPKSKFFNSASSNSSNNSNRPWDIGYLLGKR
jgi:hypothetical protein